MMRALTLCLILALGLLPTDGQACTMEAMPFGERIERVVPVYGLDELYDPNATEVRLVGRGHDWCSTMPRHVQMEWIFTRGVVTGMAWQQAGDAAFPLQVLAEQWLGAMERAPNLQSQAILDYAWPVTDGKAFHYRRDVSGTNMRERILAIDVAHTRALEGGITDCCDLDRDGAPR